MTGKVFPQAVSLRGPQIDRLFDSKVCDRGFRDCKVLSAQSFTAQKSCKGERGLSCDRGPCRL